jgi:hypothetical protein
MKVDDETAVAVVVLQTEAIVVNADGSYSVPGTAKGTTKKTDWLRSVPPRLRYGSDWLPLTLKTHSAAPLAGSDTLGSFKQVEFSWAGPAANTSDLFRTSIRVYEASGVVVFGQNFSGNITTDGRLGSDSPASWWPAFDHAPAAPPLGFLGFSGCMSGGADVGSFSPALPLAAKANKDSDRAEVDPGGALSMASCKTGAVAQEWKLLAEVEGGAADAVGCSSDATSCMFENEGNKKCLQISHCATTDVSPPRAPQAVCRCV